MFHIETMSTPLELLMWFCVGVAAAWICVYRGPDGGNDGDSDGGRAVSA